MKNVADIYPLSPVQLGMLFHTLAEGEPESSGVYVNQYTCELKGVLQLPLFQQAWQQTIERHPVLRTAFLWEGLDEPLQVVRQQVNLPWQMLDWTGEENWEKRIEAFLSGDRAKGFNLAKAPLLRLTLIQRNEEIIQLIWTSHHMLFDGWSLPLIWQDMLAYYEALLKERTPQLERVRPYRDYIAWQQTQKKADSEQFWRSQLEGFTEPTPLPAVLTAGHKVFQDKVSQGYQQQSKQIEIKPLTEFARSQRLTLNTLVQGAWALLLHHYSSKAQVMYGSVVSGRPAALQGVEKMVGLFINTLPVLASIDTEKSVVDWLKDCQQQQLSLRDYGTAALSDLQQWSDLPAGSSLFESIVVFENYPTAEAPELGFTVENARYLEQSNYPLALLVVPGESLELILLHDATRFERGAIARLLEHLELLLTVFLQQPNSKLSNLPRLTLTEQQEIDSWLHAHHQNSTSSGLLIHHMIEAQVVKTPNAEAVVFNGKSLTYEELNQQANQLAYELRSRGVTPGTFVAVCLNRSVDMVVCTLAILKAGGTYVPLDPTYPAERLAYCLQDTAPKIICTDRSVNVPSESIPCLFVDDPTLYTHPIENLPNLSQSSDLAYVIYTSGSTGQPKGVMVTHQNLVASTEARFTVYPNSVERFLLLSSIAFDSSVAGLFWALCQGGALVVAPERIEQDLHQLSNLIEKERITHTLCVPTLYGLLISQNTLTQLSTLKTVIVAGEACTRALAVRHYAKLPQVVLWNEYGPTETTVWCTAYRVPPALSPGPVAIGSAIPGVRILLLNEQRRIVPAGGIGEIHVCGAGVSQGYLNQPERTEQSFFASAQLSEKVLSKTPFSLYKTGDLGRYRADGTLEWLGRSDRQVKIRGYRIELGEIEEVLRSQPSIKETVVVARTTAAAAESVASGRAESGRAESGNVESGRVESLAEALLSLPPDEAEALLSAVEGTG